MQFENGSCDFAMMRQQQQASKQASKQHGGGLERRRADGLGDGASIEGPHLYTNTLLLTVRTDDTVVQY
jgi:hypothetical protein